MNRKLLLLLLVFSGFCSSVFSNHTTANLIFTAKMTGASEVPAVVTDGQGLAIFVFDEARSTLYFDVSLSDLTGPLTGIHIHEGEVGENGPVVYNLTSFLQGSRLKGSIPDISRASVARFFSGDYYINAHTELNPGGEIRGQIFLEADQRFTGRLTGDQEVPAVATDGMGLMIANLSHAGHLVDLHMVFAGLSSPVTGAHIHHAPAGSNGGVIFDLGPFIFGHLVIGTWDPTGYLDALRAGELYVNIHTVNNPGGEIRGQLLLEDGLLFDAVLNGDQEVPVIDTDARGVGLFNVSEDLSTLEYFVIFDSLSGDADQAHFHLGAEGRNGGVVIDLTDDIDGNIIRGSTPLSFDIFNALLDGQIYINVHTEENPGGEIRGQVYALARQGYIFDMSGGQEVPAVTTSGTGLGMVSINGSQTNAHYMVHFSNLDGEFTSSHFHHGEPGVSGPVIHDVTGSFNEFGSADDYWITGFTDATARMIREGEVYLNVHSDLYPAGEIRGNLIGVDRIFSAEEPFDPGFGNNFIFYAEMYGDSEVPPVVTDAVGLATVYFSDDRTEAVVNVTASGLSGPITGAHIHEGFEGEAGPVVFPLIFDGNRIHATITGITSEDIQKFVNGNYYINVHTAENPGGEIRGQLFLDQDVTFLALLSGDEEVPAVTTDARGLGLFHYTIGQLTLDVNVQVTGLSSEITGAHLHAGAFGENGGVIIDLGDLRDGNTIRGTVDLTLNDFFALATGNVYVNVHTVNNPGGEIRGQLGFVNSFVFDGWMSGAQENPIAITGGSGLAVAIVDPNLSEVTVIAITDAVSGVIGAAHLHMARVGDNGGVVLDLTDGLFNNDIGFSGPVSDAIVDALLTGEIYVNVHTPAYPGGELRGQLFRLARDGYGFDLCPEQEVGAINAPDATGSALVSIDRLHTNANIVAVTTGLTGAINSAHIHEAPIGVAGGIIYDLSPFFQNGAVFGYGVPLDSAVVAAILAGNAYINAHTALHPAGEVRGQIVKELLCFVETSTDELGNIVGEVSLSPVPVSDMLYVSIESLQQNDLSLQVYDLSGKLMSTERIELTNGKNTFIVNTEKLGHGFYTLMITNGEAAQAYKFVK